MTQSTTFSLSIKKCAAVGFILMYVAACAPTGSQYGSSGYQGYSPNKSQIGALAGAAGGAILGSNVGKGKGQIASIAIGTLLGAALGHQVGASLDRADQAYLQQTSMKSLESSPTGTSSSWVNPDSGNSGTITPVKTYKDNGRYCREFNQTIKVGGKTQSGYGTACRMPDGSWEIQS